VLDAVEAKIAAGITCDCDGPMTVAAYCRRWLEKRRCTGVFSVGDDGSRLRTHVLPVLGSTKLEDLRPAHVRDLVRDMVRRWKVDGTPAPRTIRNIYGVLHRMLEDAVVDDLIPVNPCHLKRNDLPAPEDVDPEWRDTAVFIKDEVEVILSDPKLPEDRRIIAALLFLAGLRFGEAAALRWRHYDNTLKPLGRLTVAKSYNAKLRREKSTKARKVRHVPVHPLLAKLLAEWKLSGWEKWYGRQPRADDLIVPSRASTADKLLCRNVGRAKWRWDEDLTRLGLRVRRQHDARRTFRSLCLSDGARRDLLQWVTHGRPGDVEGLYDQPTWDAVCSEIAKLSVQLRGAELIRLPVAAVAGSGLGTLLGAAKSPAGRGQQNPQGKAPKLVGAAGFELATPCSQSKCSNQAELRPGPGCSHSTAGLRFQHPQALSW
jgi:integrase